MIQQSPHLLAPFMHCHTAYSLVKPRICYGHKRAGSRGHVEISAMRTLTIISSGKAKFHRDIFAIDTQQQLVTRHSPITTSESPSPPWRHRPPCQTSRLSTASTQLRIKNAFSTSQTKHRPAGCHDQKPTRPGRARSTARSSMAPGHLMWLSWKSTSSVTFAASP